MNSYGQYCPIAKAAELVGERWTLLILRELTYGPIRFNEIEKNLPGISRSVLSQRLRRLERNGISVKDAAGAYDLTDTGRALRPALESLADWVAQWVMSEPTRAEADPELLMLFVSRHIDTSALPQRRVVIEWRFLDADRRLWMTLEAGDISVCVEDPVLPVDLYVSGDTAELFRVYANRCTLDDAIKRGAVSITGISAMRQGFRRWMLWSRFSPTGLVGAHVGHDRVAS